MPSATDRFEFTPPRDTGSLRAFGWALLVHALLIAALTWGVNWKRSDPAVSFEAEIWSSLPQEAAPKLVETAPVPPPPEPAPAPAPAPTPVEIKVAPPAPDVDIALKQEKKRKLLQQQKEAELQKVEKAQKLQEELKAELQAKKEKEKEKEKEKLQKAKEDLAQRKAAEEVKKADAKKQDAKDQEKEKQAALAGKKQRQDALNRMMGLAGATGGAEAKGSAQKSGGPSASYGGKVRAAVKPNVVFTEDISGNPRAEVEVRTTLDGTILSQRLLKSSGNKSWDEAVIKAIIRTGTLPPDIDGRVPTPMILEFRPKG